MKKEENSSKNLFTKEESNNIIKENYNPFTVNKNLRKKGLNMEKDILLEEIKKELTIEEKEILRKYTGICIKIYKKGIEKGFNAKL